MSAVRAHAASPKDHPKRERRIALYGGTFDPIHTGHLDVARAAQRRFHFDEIHFIPAGRPPHKNRHHPAPYANRYAMVSLGCAGNPRFLASLAEAGADGSGREVFYSVDTVGRFRRMVRGTRTRLYFLMGADSFLRIRTWKHYRALLGLCDFVVASRPGFRLELLRQVIPEELLATVGRKENARSIHLLRTTVHILDTVSNPVSASAVRQRVAANKSIRGLVSPTVEEYISKQGLYRSAS